MGRVLRYWNVILLLTIVQLAIGWIMSLPMAHSFGEAWNFSLLPSQMQEQGFSATLAYQEVLTGAIVQQGNFYSVTMISILALLYLACVIFIIAGTLPLYGGLDLKFNWERFLSDGARFFRPFLLLAIISLLFFWLADVITTSITDLVNDSLAESNDEATIFFSGLIFTNVLRFIVFSLMVMIFQYAKIAGAVEQLRNILYLLRRSAGFISKHLLQVLAVFAIITILDVLVHLLDKAIWYYMTPGDSLLIQSIWLIISTALLVFIKLVFFGAQVQLYGETRRRETESSSIKEVRRQNSYSELS